MRSLAIILKTNQRSKYLPGVILRRWPQQAKYVGELSSFSYYPERRFLRVPKSPPSSIPWRPLDKRELPMRCESGALPVSGIDAPDWLEIEGQLSLSEKLLWLFSLPFLPFQTSCFFTPELNSEDTHTHSRRESQVEKSVQRSLEWRINQSKPTGVPLPYMEQRLPGELNAWRRFWTKGHKR